MLAGPDVSDYNGTIDWSDVRLPGHELAFAISKATEGTSWTSRTFAANWHGIHAAGLIRGAYHFARPHVNGSPTPANVRAAARAEAEFFLRMLHSVGGVGPGDLPPALDLEASSGLTSAQLYEWVGAWVETMEHAVGRKPIIYTGGFWKSNLAGYTSAFGCPLWLAEYGPSAQCPRAWDRWTFWQFTDAARLQGIPEPVDLSYFNGSREELLKLAGRDRGPTAPRWDGRTLRKGMEGADVRRWQEQMRHRGFVDLPATGVFDEQCARSARWLQLYLRVPPTEQVDEQLWRDTWTAH